MNKTTEFNVSLPFGGIWNPVLGIVPIIPMNVVIGNRYVPMKKLEYRVIYIANKQLPNDVFLFLDSEGHLVEKHNDVYYALLSEKNLVIGTDHTIGEINNEMYFIPYPIDVTSDQTFSAIVPPDKTSKDELTFLLVWRNPDNEIETIAFNKIEDAKRNADALERCSIKTIMVPLFI